MVNLEKFSIRITRPIPDKFRNIVREAIEDTFLRILILYTHYFRGIDSKKLWKVVYIPWNGFFIQAHDSSEYRYAAVVNWLNYGTEPHFIPKMNKFQKMISGRIKKKFLVFPDRGDYLEQTHIKGNQAFKKDGFIYSLIVFHPGIHAKRFVEEIIEDDYINNKFYDIIIIDKKYYDLNYKEQILFLERISQDNRYAIGITA